MPGLRMIAAAMAVFMLSATESGAAELIPLRVNAFPNAKALPLHAGIAKGIFAAHGLDLALELTENSRSQRDGLAAGQFDIAQSALDNAVAMIEVARQDVVILSGGDSGMNEFIVQPEIGAFAGATTENAATTSATSAATIATSLPMTSLALARVRYV